MNGQGRQDIRLHAKELLKFQLNACQADERRLSLDGINQQVKITLVGIFAANGRPEDPRIRRIVLMNNPSDLVAVQLKSDRRLHDA